MFKNVEKLKDLIKQRKNKRINHKKSKTINLKH